jgi:hypothetical protein
MREYPKARFVKTSIADADIAQIDCLGNLRIDHAIFSTFSPGSSDKESMLRTFDQCLISYENPGVGTPGRPMLTHRYALARSISQITVVMFSAILEP